MKISILYFQAGAAAVYSLIPNIESLITYSSLAVQLKIILAMSAFFYLRWKQPDLHRPVKVRYFYCTGKVRYFQYRLFLTGEIEDFGGCLTSADIIFAISNMICQFKNSLN